MLTTFAYLKVPVLQKYSKWTITLIKKTIVLVNLSLNESMHTTVWPCCDELLMVLD